MAVMTESMPESMRTLTQSFLGDIERIEDALQLPDLTPPPAATTAEASDILIFEGLPR